MTRDDGRGESGTGVQEAPGPLRDRRVDRRVAATRRSWASGRVIEVRTDDVEMADGTATRDVVVHPGAVGIVAIDSADRVLVLQQYRHPTRRLLWEPPAGLLDVAGETPLQAARRELHEEAHLEADDWRVLVDMFTSPGMTDEVVRIFLARGIRESGQERHSGAHEEVDMPTRWVELDRAVEAVVAGELHNPLAVAGLLAAQEARRRGWTGLRPADVPFPEMSDYTGSSSPDGG